MADPVAEIIGITRTQTAAPASEPIRVGLTMLTCFMIQLYRYVNQEEK
jgi:hypothetical protein